jgi:hypothetical protein
VEHAVNTERRNDQRGKRRMADTQSSLRPRAQLIGPEDPGVARKAGYLSATSWRSTKTASTSPI